MRDHEEASRHLQESFDVIAPEQNLKGTARVSIRQKSKHRTGRKLSERWYAQDMRRTLLEII